MADRQRLCVLVAMAAEAVVTLLLKERFHRRVGCFERAALLVGRRGIYATICPQAGDQVVVLPNGNGTVVERRLRKERGDLAIQCIVVEPFGVLSVAVDCGAYVG